MDFRSDALAGGRVLHTLTVVDTIILGVEVGTPHGGEEEDEGHNEV